MVLMSGAATLRLPFSLALFRSSSYIFFHTLQGRVHHSSTLVLFVLPPFLAINQTHTHTHACKGLTLLDMGAIPRHAPDRAARQAQAAKRLMKLRGPSHTGPAQTTNPMVLNHAANYAFWRFLKLENATATATRGSSEVIVHLANPARASAKNRHKDGSAAASSTNADGSDPLGATTMDEDKGQEEDKEDVNDEASSSSATRELPEHVVPGVPVRLGHFTGSAGAASNRDGETDRGWFEAVS